MQGWVIKGKESRSSMQAGSERGPLQHCRGRQKLQARQHASSKMQGICPPAHGLPAGGREGRHEPLAPAAAQP